MFPDAVFIPHIGYNDKWELFQPLLTFNKLLNLSGNGISVTKAIPAAPTGTDDAFLVEFERMLCRMTQILTDGMLEKNNLNDIIKSIEPIVQFYYQKISRRDTHNYLLGQLKKSYFVFLVDAVSKTDAETVEKLGNYLFKQFEDYPSYWDANLQRTVTKSLIENGYNIEKCKLQLIRIESFMLINEPIDERINACTRQAKVWLDLNEKVNAERCFRKTFETAIGVGYSKDDQFSTWVAWLDKIIHKISKEEAIQLLHWFLTHLEHVEKTTENANYSQELLETTLNWNFAIGYGQLIWLLDKGFIFFNTGMRTFMTCFVKKITCQYEFVSITNLYLELFVFISGPYNTQILDDLLKKGFEQFSYSFFEKYLAKFINAIQTNAVEQSRYELLSTIDNYCKSLNINIINFYPQFKLPINPYPDSSNSSKDNNYLVLKQGNQRLSETDVLEKAKDFASLKALILVEADKRMSYFDWSNTITPVLPLLSIQELNELSDIVHIQGSNSKKSNFYAKLSAAALKLGDKGSAERLANKSLEKSSASGWMQPFGDSTRLTAFEAFRSINAQASYDKAFKQFTHDIITTNAAGGYVESLHHILPAIGKHLDEVSIWKEIFDYLQRLMSNSTPIQDLPAILVFDKPIAGLLTDYLLYLSKNPTYIIQTRAMKILALNIDAGDKAAMDALKNLNINDHSEVAILNEVIMYLLQLKSAQLIEFKLIAIQLATSKNYLIRKNACQILASFGEAIPKVASVKRPALYDMYLDSPQKLQGMIEQNLYQPTVDINNPEDMIRPYGNWLQMLSELSGIERTNLLYQHYSIMKRLDSPNHWTVEAETERREQLETIKITYTFPRPRVLIAKKALMYLVAELVDANLIPKDATKNLELFESYDYAIPFFKQTEKPFFIQTLKTEQSSSVAEHWVKNIESSTRLSETLLTDSTNRKIIGEYSIVKSLGWGKATETYVTQLSIYKQLENDFFIFGSAFQQKTANYYNLDNIRHFIIIVREDRLNWNGIKSNWLAINPALAKYLGWQPEYNKLFGWKDKDGILMAESIFWSNGNIHMPPPQIYSEAGEGWFVVVSNEALQQIQEICHQLFIQKSLRRAKQQEKEKIATRIFECKQ